MKFFGLFDVGERKVFDKARNVIEHSKKANALLLRIINGSNDIHQMKRITQESDDEVFDISNSITSGAIAPNLIDDMLGFVKQEDSIVDNIYNLSKAYVRYKSPSKAANKYIKANLTASSKLVGDALALLYKMHALDRIDDIKKLRAEVRRIEQESDDLRDEMLTYAYKSRIGFKTFDHITGLAYLADDVLDSCQDSSDMYMSIMLSILT